MSPASVLDAIRNLVAAAGEQGWDALPDLKPVLDAGRDAHAAPRPSSRYMGGGRPSPR